VVERAPAEIEQDRLRVAPRSQSAPGHLQVEGERLRWPREDDTFAARQIPALGEHADVRHELSFARREAREDLRAHVVRRLAVEMLCAYASVVERARDRARVLDTGREYYGRSVVRALAPCAYDLAGHLGAIDGTFELVKRVVPGTHGDRVEVDWRAHREHARRGEVAIGDEPRWRRGDHEALVGVAETSPVGATRRRGEPDDTRASGAVEKSFVCARLGVVRLVDNDERDVARHLAARERLHAGDLHACAGRRCSPSEDDPWSFAHGAFERGSGLVDQLSPVREPEHARAAFEHTRDDRGSDDRLPRAGRRDDEHTIMHIERRERSCDGSVLVVP
jgi:hypothetical protein